MFEFLPQTKITCFIYSSLTHTRGEKSTVFVAVESARFCTKTKLYRLTGLLEKMGLSSSIQHWINGATKHRYCWVLLNIYPLSTVGNDKRSFQSYQKMKAFYILSTLRADIPFDCQSWQQWLSELPKTWKTLCFLSTIGFDNQSFQNYIKTGRCYAFCQLSQLTTITFRTPKFLPIVRVNIPMGRSFQSYQNFVNCQIWHFFPS